MLKTILIALAVVVFVAWFVRKAKQVRETKARVRLAHMKWLLEKDEQCDLEAWKRGEPPIRIETDIEVDSHAYRKAHANDDTKTRPGPGAIA